MMKGQFSTRWGSRAMACLAFSLLMLGCDDGGSDDEDPGADAALTDDAGGEPLTAEQEALVSTCWVAFEAGVRAGPSQGFELRGLLKFPGVADGALADTELLLDDGTRIPVTGTIDGERVDLRFDLGDQAIEGTGTLGSTEAGGCGGRMLGPFTGPQAGDEGDWEGFAGLASSAGGGPTYSANPVADGQSLIYRSESFLLQTLAIGGRLGAPLFRPGGLGLTREAAGASERLVIWVTDLATGNLLAFADEGTSASHFLTIEPADFQAAAELQGLGPIAPFQGRAIGRGGNFFEGFKVLFLSDEANHVIWSLDRTDPTRPIAEQLRVALGQPGQAGGAGGIGGAAKLNGPAYFDFGRVRTRVPPFYVIGREPTCQRVYVYQGGETPVPTLRANSRISALRGCEFAPTGE